MESIYHSPANERSIEREWISGRAWNGVRNFLARVSTGYRVLCRLNTVVCGVVLNDLNIRCNVNCSTVIPKGSQVEVNVLDVVPDCLKIKVSLLDSYRDEEYDEYSKVL